MHTPCSHQAGNHCRAMHPITCLHEAWKTILQGWWVHLTCCKHILLSKPAASCFHLPLSCKWECFAEKQPFRRVEAASSKAWADPTALDGHFQDHALARLPMPSETANTMGCSISTCSMRPTVIKVPSTYPLQIHIFLFNVLNLSTTWVAHDGQRCAPRHLCKEC